MFVGPMLVIREQVAQETFICHDAWIQSKYNQHVTISFRHKRNYSYHELIQEGQPARHVDS
jgi:hypothetical protein